MKMWGAKCDSCGEQFEMMEGWIATTDKSVLKDDLSDSDWCMTEDEKTYCPDCHSSFWDDESDERIAYYLHDDGHTDILGKII